MSNAVHETDSKNTVASKPPLDPHLKALENEAIHIFREVAAEFDNPVMLYSIGKDSSVLLHLARKAFFPGMKCSSQSLFGGQEASIKHQPCGQRLDWCPLGGK